MASSTEFNPFGLTDTRTLSERRRDRRDKQSALRRSKLSGMDFAGAETGAAIADAIRLGLGKAGLVKDRAAEDAEAVTSAVKRASITYQSIPDELKEKDAFGASIQKRKQLVQELENAGLGNEADKVRSQLVALAEQQEKFLKSQGERAKTDIEVERARGELKAEKEGRREKDELSRLQNTLATLDPSDPIQAARMDQINDRITKITTITGTTEFDEGASDKVTVRKVEQSIIENQQTLDGFFIAQNTFNPDFLTMGTKIKNFGVKMAEIAGLDIPEEAKAGLREFTGFKQQTSSNLNAYIKAITGAQMSNPEAIRLKKDVPTVDDSPSEYQAKLENVIRKLGAVQARSMAAMAHVNDRQKFIKTLATGLDEFIDTGEGNAEQNEANQAEQEALQALQNLEASLGPR